MGVGGGGQGAIRGDQEGFTGGGAATGGIHITVSQVQLVEAAQTLTLTRALPIEDVNSTLGSSQRFWKQLTTCRHLTRKITHGILSQPHRGWGREGLGSGKGMKGRRGRSW
jgi:hypothetical protein